MTDSMNLLAHLRALRASAADAHQAAAAITQLAGAEGESSVPPSIEPRTIATDGGDDAEGTIDKRAGTFIEGNQYTLLFRGDQFLRSLAHLYSTPATDYAAALRHYLICLYRHYATVDLRGIDDRPLDMPVSELYVALTLHEPAPDDQRGPGALRGFMESTKKSGVAQVTHGTAAARISPTRKPGYQHRKVSSQSSLSTGTRTWSSKWAPRWVHCICCFFTIRLLTTWLTVDSTNPVLIRSP